ncbi:MAG: hypothetical protein QXE02_07795 [Sulfolobales archaeon]
MIIMEEVKKNRYWRIDTHVHCRDWGESYKATIGSVVRLALSKGIGAVFDMPNTDPPILGLRDAEKRLRTAEDQGVLKNYYLYIAATPNEKQLEDAVRAYEELPRVVGLKLYTAPMKGLEALSLEEQEVVYRTLSSLGYRGVLAIHCEKHGLFRETLWDPLKPYTWNLARPPEAEVRCIEDQILLAKKHGFKGTLYIVHISTKEGVEIVRRARNEGIRIVCGVTPHHIIYDTDHMRTPESVVLKTNPPIRDPATARALLRLAIEGAVDFLETDHAPHSPQEKTGPPYLSGNRSLEIYEIAINMLMRSGASEKTIYMLTRGNAESVFKKLDGID